MANSDVLSLWGGVLVGFGVLQTFWMLIVPMLLWCNRKSVRGIVRKVERVGDTVWVEASYSDPLNGELRVTDKLSANPSEEYVAGYSHFHVSAYLCFHRVINSARFS
jgi:hypothetical protein